MSFVFAAPEALAAAAADMAGIGSTLNAANVVAAVPTTGVLAAAADEVSTQVAALLSAHAQGYQQLSRQMMTAFHDQFVQALRASADAYATAEASAAQTMVNAVNAPARALLGHPLISADASTGGGSNALSRVQSMFLGTGGSSALGGSAAANAAASGALQLQPTGGANSAPWLPIERAAALDGGADWVPQAWRDMDTTMVAAPLGDTHTAVVLGRPGPEFRPSEVARLGYLAGIVATMLR